MPDHDYDHVIYHAGCPDGFTSAWLLHGRQPEAHIHEGRYGQPPPSGLSGHVVIADFSYPPAQLTRMAETVDRITLIDHHQTAIEAIVDHDGPLPANLTLVLDQKHSGAYLVARWLGLTDTTPDGVAGSAVWVPEVLLACYVEDRDLWRFRLPHSHEITAYVNACPMVFDEWDHMAYMLAHEQDSVVMAGAAVIRRNRVLIDQIKATARPFELQIAAEGFIEVMAVGSPYGLGSDTAGELAAASMLGIGAYYIDYPDRREFGLRSTDNGPDVAKIAEHYGGGGHEHASGFRISRDSDHPLLTA